MPRGTNPSRIETTRIETTRIVAERSPSGCRVRAGGGVMRVMTMESSGAHARVALVPERALLLAGDHVRLEIVVHSGVTLHVVETTGTVAYAMRGGTARWEVRAEVEDDAGLVLDALPWVSAEGSSVQRRFDVELGRVATLVQRETLVLGRHGESAGTLSSRTDVRRGGWVLLVEEFDARDLTPHRVLESIVSIGPQSCPTPAGVTRLDLVGGGTVLRSMAEATHDTAAAFDDAWGSLVSAVLTPGAIQPTGT